MVHTISISEAVLTDSIAKLLLEDVNSVCTEANWWHPRVRIVENWLREDANRASIPDDGTEEMIHKHVQRGDIYPQTQFKCWKHILLELRDLSCFDSVLLHDQIHGDDFRATVAPANASPSRGKLRPGKELIILSDETNQDSGSQDASLSSSTSSEKGAPTTTNGKKLRPNSSTSRRTGAESGNGANSQAAVGINGDGEKTFAGMSMMERQAEWLKKKQDKMEAERLRQEEEKEKELTFQPKIIRRVTYTSGDKPSKETTATTTAPQRQLQRGESYNNSRKAETAVTAGPKEKSIPKPPRGGSKMKRRKSQLLVPQSVTQPIEISSDLLDSMKSELEASKASRRISSGAESGIEGSEEVEVDEDIDGEDDDDQDRSPGTDSALNKGATPILDDAALPTKSWSERPTINGRRVDFDSGDTKARLVLQDASRFDLTSMYRKTDKKAGRDGVALLMGRREDTFEEEVIAVLFDREKVSELDAARWWLDHEHRFSEFLRAST